MRAEHQLCPAGAAFGGTVRPRASTLFKRILIVCTGNICRSPLAEAWFRRALPGAEVSSAGVGALVGRPAEPDACAVGESHGLDLSDHRARQITLDMASQQDLILALDHFHLQWLQEHYAHLRGRIFLLGHWSDKSDVPDPFRRERRHFEHAFELIRDYSEDWLTRIGAISA